MWHPHKDTSQAKCRQNSTCLGNMFLNVMKQLNPVRNPIKTNHGLSRQCDTKKSCLPLQKVFKMILLACSERKSDRLDQMKEVFLTLLDKWPLKQVLTKAVQGTYSPSNKILCTLEQKDRDFNTV